MSEDTHYQVALTNGQVLTAFAVLLGCLVAVFFAGVWLGRGAAEEVPAYAAAAPDLPEVQEEFAFFSGDETDADAGKGEAPAPAAEPTPRPRPRSAADRRQPAPPKPAAREEPASAPPPPVVEPDLPTATTTAPPPEAMEPPASRAAAVAEPPPTIETATAAGFMIQVFATGDRTKAAELVDRLVDADFSAYLAPSGDLGREVFRVRVGPLPDRQTAEVQASELERRWGLESWISDSAP